MEKKTVGSGLTTASILTYSSEEWTQKAREDKEFFKTGLPTYLERLLSWRDWAIRVLEGAGRPTEDRAVEVRSDGTWAYESDIDQVNDDGTNARRSIAGLSYSDAEEEETLKWYASQILRLVYQELAYLSPNDGMVETHSQRAIRTAEQRRLAHLASRGTACQLGCLLERVRWKFAYEEAALMGLARMDSWRARQTAGAQARKAKGQQTAEQIESLLVDVAEKSSSSFLEQSIATIIRRIRQLKAKSAQQFSDSTLRRHLKIILPRVRKSNR